MTDRRPRTFFASHRTIRSARATALAIFLSIPSTGLAQPAQNALPNEQMGIVSRALNFYGDPGIALSTYAALDRNGGCTGAMIGPNLMVTAAHCGQISAETFVLYRSATAQTREVFTSTQLAHTFIDTDFVLRWVAPNAAGENPGDKYGWLDPDIAIAPSGRFDYRASRQRVAVATPIYGIWQGSLAAQPGTQQLFVSTGEITANDVAGQTENPNRADGSANWRCHNNGPSRSIGVRDDAWGAGGASGSVTVSAERRKLLLGPLSKAGVGVVGAAARGRNHLAYADYLALGFFDPNNRAAFCNPPHAENVDVDALRALGVEDPAQFYGRFDKDRDGVLDIQEALERVSGETARDFYWLGFDSPRRNALWTVDQPRYVSWHPDERFARIEGRDTTDTSVRALSHRRLNLDPERAWRVSLTASVIERGDAPIPFEIVIEDDPTTARRVPLFPRTAGPYLTARFDARSDGFDALHLTVGRGAAFSISGVSIIAEGTVMDFDTHDKRVSWQGVDGGPPLIWPNGIASQTQPDWAAVVRRPQGTVGDYFPLRHDGLGLLAGEEARVCFQTRRAPRIVNWPSGMTWVARVREGFGVVRDSEVEFTPGSDWAEHCTGWFTPNERAGSLEFGSISESRLSTSGYLVDAVRIERRG